MWTKHYETNFSKDLCSHILTVRPFSLLDLISVIMFSTRPDWQPCSEIVLVSFCQRFSFFFFLHVLLVRAYDLCKFWIAHMIVFRSFYRSIIPLLLLDYEAANIISWEVKPVDILVGDQGRWRTALYDSFHYYMSNCLASFLFNCRTVLVIKIYFYVDGRLQ